MVWMAWILFAWQNTPASHRRCQRNKKNEKTKIGMVGREGGREGGTWGAPLSISSVFILFIENSHYPSPQAPTPIT